MGGWTTGHSNFNSITHMNVGDNSDTRLINNNMFEFVINTIGPSDTPVWHQIAQVGINRDPDFTGSNVNITEKVINTIGQSDVPRWHLVVNKDIPITAGGEAWKIPLTFATNGINMPVELEGLRENNILENRHSFNVSINNSTGPVTSKPTETNIPVREAMVVAGNWRTPHTDYSILKELFTFNTKNYQGAGLMSSKPIIVNIPVREQMVIDDDHWRTPWEAAALPVGAFRIAGTGTADGRVLIIDEDTWEIEQTKLVSEGNYEVTGLQSGLKTVVDRKSDGESAAFGAVEAVSEE